MAAEKVLEFMRCQNRPYSLNDILKNVGKDFEKSAVQKSLDLLVKKNELFEKIYNKQKIYCVVQKNENNSQKLEEQFRAIDHEINEITINLKNDQEKLLINNNELKQFQNMISLKEAKEKQENLKKEIAEFKSKLDEFSEDFKPISEEEKVKICTEYEKYVKEFKKRRRLCTDMINEIMEGYPKSKKHLMEDVGIETDEDVGFQLVEILK